VTRYAAGRELEYRVRDLFVEAGFLVIRAAGSKGLADLVALPRHGVAPEWALGRPVLIQCKRSGVLGPAEWNDLVTAAYSASAVPVMARYTPRRPIELFLLTGLKMGRGRQPMTKLDLRGEVNVAAGGSETGGN
jgi:Holliday junction resolvase